MMKVRERKLLAKEAIEALYSTEPDAFLLLSENNIALSFMTGNKKAMEESEAAEEAHKKHEESETPEEEKMEHEDDEHCEGSDIKDKVKSLMMEFLALKEKVELLKTGITDMEIMEPLDDIFAALETAAHHCTDLIEEDSKDNE